MWITVTIIYSHDSLPSFFYFSIVLYDKFGNFTSIFIKIDPHFILLG